MGFTVSFQTWVFLGSIGIGAILGIGYDLFRISRVAFPLPSWFILAEDCCFFLLCALVTFGYMLNTTEGRVRLFILAGEMIGFTLYYLTIGSVVMAVARVVFRFVYGVLKALYSFFLAPWVRLLRHLFKLLKKRSKRVWAACKKQGNKTKFRLKQQRLLLYNLIREKPGKAASDLQNSIERSDLK